MERHGTSEDKYVKTTINIRKWMMEKVSIRMRSLGKEYFVDYLRDLIMNDLKVSGSISYTQHIMEMADDPEMAKHFADRFLKYPDKPKKYPGFDAGLAKNSWVKSWWLKKKENY